LHVGTQIHAQQLDRLLESEFVYAFVQQMRVLYLDAFLGVRVRSRQTAKVVTPFPDHGARHIHAGAMIHSGTLWDDVVLPTFCISRLNQTVHEVGLVAYEVVIGACGRARHRFMGAEK
jgi:hypothetical protein